MIEMNAEEIYDVNKSVPDNLHSNEPRFSTSRYAFGLAYLTGHKHSVPVGLFPKVNPTQEDFSRLVSALKEAGLKI